MHTGEAFETMTAQACRAALAHAGVAYLGVCIGALPSVVPARCVFDAPTAGLLVSVPAAPGAARALDGTIVAVAIDTVEPESGRRCWVHLLGLASLLDEVPAPLQVGTTHGGPAETSARGTGAVLVAPSQAQALGAHLRLIEESGTYLT